jgi:hypothetical protein
MCGKDNRSGVCALWLLWQQVFCFFFGTELEGGMLDEPEISIGGGGVHLVQFLQSGRTESVTLWDVRIPPHFPWPHIRAR